jgi:hypothetical protein
MNVHAPTDDKTDDLKDSLYEEVEHWNHMNILLGDFSAKVGREDMFKPTIENESLHEISNDTWKSPDGKTHNRIGHILVDRQRHSNVLDVRSFRVTDCDSDHGEVQSQEVK